MCSSGLLCCMYVCPTIHKYMCVCVCVGGCVLVCVCVYIHVCMYVYIYTYVHVYIYIHTYVYATSIRQCDNHVLQISASSPRYINSGIKKPELKAVSARASIEFQLQLIRALVNL